MPDNKFVINNLKKYVFEQKPQLIVVHLPLLDPNLKTILKTAAQSNTNDT